MAKFGNVQEAERRTAQHEVIGWVPEAQPLRRPLELQESEPIRFLDVIVVPELLLSGLFVESKCMSSVSALCTLRRPALRKDALKTVKYQNWCFRIRLTI